MQWPRSPRPHLLPLRRLLLSLALAAPAVSQTWSFDFVEPFTNFTQDIGALPNGQVVVVRGVGQVAYHVTLLDANGGLAWDRRFWIEINGLATGAANEIAVAGWTYPNGSTTVLDSSGSYVFAKYGTNHGGVAEDYFHDATQTADGGWVFVGAHTHDSCDLGMLVRRLDSAGNLLWDARVGSENFLLDLPGYDVQELPDGTILVCGRAWPNPMLMKFDASGALLWKKSFGVGKCLRPQMAVDAALGRVYLVAGGSWPGSGVIWDDDFTVLAADFDGNAIWQRRYGGAGADIANDLVVTPDGGVLVVGSTQSYGSTKRDMWLVKLTDGGDVQWQHTYGGDSDDELSAIANYPGGGFVGAGNRRNRVSGETTGVVLRFDAEGKLSPCEPFPTWAAPVRISANEFDPFGDPIAHSDTLVDASPCTPDGAQNLMTFCDEARLGTAYCSPAVPNSSGQPAALTAVGSTQVADNLLAVVGTQLPKNQWGYFVTGQGNGVTAPPGSQGLLCLDGMTIHRFVSQVQSAGSDGTIGFEPDLSSIPGHGAILPGETWNFQLWFRDQNPANTSNFSDALAVLFQ